MSGINEQVINAEIYQIGPQGIPGEAATISVGTVTTGEPGTDASVTNSGTSSAAILDFVIPQGEQGLQGIQGPQGIQGLTGATGNGISSIEKITTVGLTDTYRITFTNNTYYDFEVINGSSISDIEKTNTSGLVDTYTITLTNGNTHTFTVTNGAKGDKGETGEVGNGILGVNKMSTTGLVDNYRMTFTNGTYFDFDVTNAKSIVSISKISTSGLIDTYRITFNDNTNFQFPVTNGNGVSGVTLLSWEGLDKTYRMTFTNGTYFDFVVSNGAEGQAEWGGISGVLSNQHDLQDALDAKAGASQTHALKGYEDNGELLTDAEGLADVTNYAHSSFDLSKFTVVGSPNITDDGIASGFSASGNLNTLSYISISNSDISTANNWKISIPFTTPDSIPADKYILTGINYYGFEFAFLSSKKIRLSLTATDGTTKILTGEINNGLGITTLELSHNYIANLIFTGSAYKMLLTDTLTGVVTTEFNISSSLKIRSLSGFDIGLRHSAASSAFTGSIDLKQFSITVDGVEVFSGNKTGIDTIKPDDYTVVGTPTISADGVASGFTTSSYLSKNLGTIVTSEHTIEFKAKGKFTTDTTKPFFNVVLNTSPYLVQIYNGNLSVWLNESSSRAISIDFNASNFQHGDEFELYLKLSSGNNRAIFTVNGNEIFDRSNEVTYTPNNITTLQIGRNWQGSCNGSIDLNAFKIYVDGNLVYQPCLKIPYTESKTGSKIVNATYRDRVNDMAEQFGYANYYTLSDTDFTLPQGEVYGFIGDKTLRDSYYNGVTYWELFSNRRLEQGGSCESGVEYTLPKPFADANYVLTIPYSSKTATSFIPSATGDFIAKGTGLL